ncbi:MAG: hypothetical protein HZA93_18665 [Verrucomicrobia bacterium]|nr:hypothetical protein [Verrucomicrobiota bacterium]
MQNTEIIIVGAVVAVAVGVALFRWPARSSGNSPGDVATVAPSIDCRRRNRRHNPGDHDSGVTLWISTVECAMAVVLVLATMVATDAMRPSDQPPSREQVIVDATPDFADHDATPANASGGSTVIRPTHKLVALDTTGADSSAIIIELDGPLPPDRPMKFLINSSTNPSRQ